MFIVESSGFKVQLFLTLSNLRKRFPNTGVACARSKQCRRIESFECFWNRQLPICESPCSSNTFWHPNSIKRTIFHVFCPKKMVAPWFRHGITHRTHLNKAAICTKNPTKTVWTWTQNFNMHLMCTIQWWQTHTIECAAKLGNMCINCTVCCMIPFTTPAIWKTLAFTNGQAGSQHALLIFECHFCGFGYPWLIHQRKFRRETPSYGLSHF